MVEPIQFTPEELRRWAGMIADLYERRGDTRIGVERDAHWVVWFEDAFGFEAVPEPVVGSVSDAVRDLRKDDREHRQDPAAMLPLSHICHHLSEVLSFLAHRETTNRGAV